MEKAVLVSWRDIPAQVTLGKGRAARRHLLPKRFEKAIDRAAMRARLSGTDDYLSQWRREAVEVEDAATYAETLAREYDMERLRDLVANYGWEAGRNPEADAGSDHEPGAAPRSTPADAPDSRPSS